MNRILDAIINPGHVLAGVVRKFWGHFTNDEIYLKIVYFFEMGHFLNLKTPQTFTEKIQWLKLFDRKPEYIQMVDKIKAKTYVSNIIGSDYIVPLLGEWDSFDEIDFSLLPNEFVLKTNHGSGSSGVVICRDKNELDVKSTRKCLEASLRSNTYNKYREWPYKQITPKIFAEKLIKDNSGSTFLTDYKFFCFNGKVKYCQVIKNRDFNETIDFYDLDWKHQGFIGLNPKARNSTSPIPRPVHLNEMVNIAERLCKHHLFLRVDLYEVNNHVYFGEMTFYPASGFGKFTPRKFDLFLGNLLELPIH